MAKKAQSFVDVVLGEAVSGTRAQRYDDMRAVASGIVNRARALGVSPEDVISAANQYDAYGKALPPGTEAFRDLAEQAIADVIENGPTHTGMFQATPAAAKNLPAGLTPVAQTAGHIYFDDPLNRPIRTAVGYIAPNKAAIDPTAIEPASFFDRLSAPIDSAARTVGDIYARFTGAPVDVPSYASAPTPRPDPSMGVLSYDLENARRSQVPSSGIGWKVHDVANDVIPGVDTSLYSGMEPPGARPVGAAHRHPLGFAGDFTFSKAGQQITDPVALHDIAMGMAAKYGANIGYSAAPGDYMGPGRMHIDTMPLDRYAGAPQWGQTAQQWASNLDFARRTGIGPTPYSNPPTPSARKDALAQIAETAKQSSARQAMGQTMAQAGITSVGGRKTSTPSPVRPDNFTAPGQLVGTRAPSAPTNVAGQPANDYAGFEARRASAFSNMPAAATATARTSPVASQPASVASINPASITSFGSLTAPSVASITPAALSMLPTRPSSVTAPVAATTITPTTITPTVVPPVRPAPVHVAPVARVPAPAPRANVTSPVARASTPSYSATDVWSGRAPAGAIGIASNGAQVSRDRFGNTSITNQFGATTTFDASGRMVGTVDSPVGKAIGNAASEYGPGILGGVLGSAVAGPLGGLLGSMVANKATGKKTGGLLGSLFGGGSRGGSSSGSKGGNSSGRASGRTPGADRSHAGN